MDTYEKFKGVFPALLTPFDSQDRINRKELEKLVAHNLKLGAKGFYVCGSTGEALLMSAAERMEVMEIVRAAAPDATCIAHVGTVNEREALALAAKAKELGYDAVSSMPPYYYRFSAAEIRDYYFRLADAASLPMLVYHIPALSGVDMGQGTLSEMLSDSRVMGIKYTSNDLFMLERIREAFPDKILYNGYDEIMLAGLSMGVDGGIGSTYNFMADKFVEIRRLFGEARIEEAKAVQKEANRIIAVLCQVGVMAAEKEILCQLGLDFGSCRRPFSPLGEEAKALLAKEVLPYIPKIG